LSEVLPTLGLCSIAAIRLVAGMNKMAMGFQGLKFNQTLNDTVIRELRQFEGFQLNLNRLSGQMSSGIRPISFVEIELKGVVFRYESSDKPVLNDISLCIRRGQSVGIVGQSGAGKSTLMDILLGLLVQQEGKVLVNGTELKDVLLNGLP